MKYQYIKTFLVLSLFVVLISCNHDHSGHDHTEHDDNHAGHEHGEETGTDDHEDVTMVHLNQAQFEHAEIDTGWFSMKNINNVINASGYTKLDPQDEAVVSLPVEGTVTSIKIIEGNRVKKGQTLATVSSLAFTDLQLDKSKLEEELGIINGKLEYLELDYTRQKTLAESNVNAQKAMEKASSDVNIEKARRTSLQKQLQLLDDKIALIGHASGGAIQIKAPISGYVTEINVTTGSLIQPSVPLFYIVDNSQMHVDLLVYEKDLFKLEVGQTVRFMLTNQTNKEIRGTVYNIGKSFANDTKSVAVHADIEKNDENLIPGMYINALIDIGSEVTETLPEEAIVMAEGRNFIFVTNNLEHEDHDHEEGQEHDHEKHGGGVHADEIEFTRIEVKTNSKQLGFVSVTVLEPIPEGAKIVTQGSYYLQSHLQKSEGGGGHSH